MTSSILPIPIRRARASRYLPTGTAQCGALLCVLLINALVADNFFAIHIQDGRLFGSLIDILNRCAPVALLSLGMTLVIATGGIDLSVGAVMAISGATMASMATGDHSIPVILCSVLGVGLLCGLWNGVLVAVFKIQPIVATLILMVAGRGIAQLITQGQIITFNNEALAWLGSGSLFYLPTPVIITLGAALLIWLLTKRTALGLFIEAVGINIKAANNAGLNTPMVVIATYLLSGMLAAVAGMIVAADIRGADANNAGLWLEMDAILAGNLADGRTLQPRTLPGRHTDHSRGEHRHSALRLSAPVESNRQGHGGAGGARHAIPCIQSPVFPGSPPCLNAIFP
ncbi:sugar ABC transporter permease [Aeromonas salmonicida subsp. salmonicida]|uniref:ABC-type sugar transporter, permease protein n=1 Tax=Aeromonas salmonicida (strain A449) TaxID=382245 RepID=A4SMT1_AERS4|nr:ABC transporter permease [Aeromonas salmonicida]ABO90203.1 ABC-type sugar transporter, permease protein [Aeromonas salmonicida subsp. salmonicida A449]MCK3678890.1 ABC transporter permease [Aeromonas salmonicida subsp. salmonicida]MCR4455560.1 ABC transporter permease [Aeromonas salmonicida]OAH77843.1 sugar ABC transporter permease [Aeromonas salmonicida subsp. salmonicida]OAH81279.1 sugar ABC transporter permease [Aeromonas salmonicida subsp. salmonicida]